MSQTPILSLCIPTNGVEEWVFPVLDSIFDQNADSSAFEVVVTDNGKNREFKTHIREKYLFKYDNLVYAETDAPLFLNEIESYKRARGELIKFVNHRTCLVDGAINKLIQFVKEHIQEKPIVYFANGVLTNQQQMQCSYPTFDLFVKGLSYWSSWSTGMTIWKSDFNRLPEDTVFNYLFPHTTILFQERNREEYIIDNTVLMKEIPVSNKPKGNYDLFYAFAVEYPAIIMNLMRSGDITADTFLLVRQKNLEFLSSLYLNYIVRKKACSYDLSGYRNSIQVFYSHMQVYGMLLKIILRKMLRMISAVAR